ncbi:hypothetical protein [Aliiroseovarius marinus]
MIRRWISCLKTRLRDLMTGDRLKRAIERNEHAVAELDATVREVLQK